MDIAKDIKDRIIGAASRSLNLDSMLAEVLGQVIDSLDFEAGLVSMVNLRTGRLDGGESSPHGWDHGVSALVQSLGSSGPRPIS